MNDLPTSLDTPAFRAAWADWCAHRRDLRKPVTPRAATIAFRRLAEWGEPAAIAAIEHSITAGYQGIFPAPKAANTPTPQNKPLSTWELQERIKSITREIEDTIYPGDIGDLPPEKQAHVRQLIAARKALRAQLNTHP
jgi:hypothetical protein